MAFGFTQVYEIKARPNELMWRESIVLTKSKIRVIVPAGYRARIIFNGKNYNLSSSAVNDAKQFGGKIDVYVVNGENAEKSVKYGLSDIISLHTEQYPDLQIKHGISGEYKLTVRDDDLFFGAYHCADDPGKAASDDFKATVTEAVKNAANKALADSDKTLHSFYPLIDGVKTEAVAAINAQIKGKGLAVRAITVNFNVLPESEEVLKKMNDAEITKYLKLIKSAGEGKKQEAEKPVKAPKEEKADGGFCTACGARLTAGAKFCAECGADVKKVENASYCGKCGNKYGGKGSFCSFCGNKIR